MTHPDDDALRRLHVNPFKPSLLDRIDRWCDHVPAHVAGPLVLLAVLAILGIVFMAERW